MLKVLHLLSSDRFSGAENVVCQIITAFDGDSEVEHLYVSPEGPIRETLKEKNIRYVPVKYLNGIDLKRIVRIEQPDIIHAHDMLASLFATFCVRNIPIVSHIHNNNFGFKGVGPFVTSLAYCIAARRAKHIFWVSEAAYNGFRYKKICSSKSSVLYNVINIEELNNSIKIDPEKYQYDLIFLGRLTYAKNPQRVLEVTKILKNQKDDIKVAMVGAGELENELRNFVKDNQLEKNVDFWGFRKNPYKILKNSQVMIMTSRWEGLGMCALEAMALGVPVVSTPTLATTGISPSLNASRICSRSFFGVSPETIAVPGMDQVRRSASFRKRVKTNIPFRFTPLLGFISLWTILTRNP